MGKKLHIAALVISGVSLCLALYANYVAVASVHTAHEANRISKESVQIVHQINLPAVSAIIKVPSIPNNGSVTEEIRINNGGAPVREFSAEAYKILRVYFTDTDEEVFVPLDGYFEQFDITGNSQGLLQISYAENNYYYLNSITTDFLAAASADGYEPVTFTITLLLVRYRDYTMWCHYDWFTVDNRGSKMEDSDWAEEILDSIMINRYLAKEQGITFSIIELSGADLWKWCKWRTR